MKITKRFLDKKGACSDGVELFLQQNKRSIEGVVGIKLLIKLDKLDYANWLIARLMSYKQYVSYGIYAAEQVIANFEKKYPNDDRPRKAIEAAKKCLKSPTKKNKQAAYSAYSAAYSAADSAAHSAAYSAYSAAYSAYSAAHSAAYSAADSAARNKMQIKILKYGIKLLKEA